MLSNKLPFTVVISTAIYVIAELFALYILLTQRNSFLFLIIHFTGSLITSAILSAAIRGKVENSKKSSAVILLLLLCLPIGGLFLSIGTYFLLNAKNAVSDLRFKTIDIENVLNEFIQTKSRKFGEGALKLAPFFKQKEKTLLFLRELLSPFSIKVARNFLKDRNDEVRLGAFSILIRLEKRINNRISELKESYKQEETRAKRALIARELAYYYWELLYFNLPDKELEKFIVEETLKYASEAFKVLRDTRSAFIMGRVFLRQKKFEEAWKFLSIVYREGNRLERNRAIPYLAEAAFYQGNYQKVKDLFGELPYSIRPEVHFEKVFWSGRGCGNS